jgi:hypothetical protein
LPFVLRLTPTEVLEYPELFDGELIRRIEVLIGHGFAKDSVTLYRKLDVIVSRCIPVEYDEGPRGDFVGHQLLERLDNVAVGNGIE